MNNNDNGQSHGVLAALGNAISTRINNALSTYVKAISNDYLKNVGQQGYDGTIYVTDGQLKQANALEFVSTVVASDAMIGASSSLLQKSGDSVIFGSGSGNVTGKMSGEANSTSGWKVGDDIYKTSAKGNEPGWNTVK